MNLKADEQTGCPKVSVINNYTDIWEEYVPQSDDKCMRFTYKEIGVECIGDGYIVCCPGIISFETINVELNVPCN